MKTLIPLLALFVSSSALAEFSVECRRADRSGVFLDDSAVDWILEDTGNPLIGKRADIPASKEGKDALEFALDNGTSLRQVYSFRGGINECQSEGTSEAVKLTVSQRSPTGEERAIERLRCTCASD